MSYTLFGVSQWIPVIAGQLAFLVNVVQNVLPTKLNSSITIFVPLP